jgi:hypothetical protein
MPYWSSPIISGKFYPIRQRSPLECCSVIVTFVFLYGAATSSTYELSNGAMNDERADEQALIRQIVQGNLRAYQVLVERYQRLVLHMVSRVIRQPEDVEDVCQEVFIKVYKHLPEY